MSAEQETDDAEGETGAADRAPVRVTTRIGRYVVVDRLGAGAMGIVYAAQDPQLNRPVAVKLLHPEVAEGGSGGRRLVREAQALAQLRHENVVAVYDVGEHDGAVFVAMELVEGRSMRAWLDASGGRRPWQEVVSVFAQAARGLAAAHAVGLVHRDFKPDNVMIDAHGRACVMDFGLVRAMADGTGEIPKLEPPRDDAAARHERALLAMARVRERLAAAGRIEVARVVDGTADTERDDDAGHDSSMRESPALLTRAGALLGTPAYMSPEQVRGGAVDARSDQFSFCISLFEALHGRRPFTGHTMIDLLRNIAEGRQDDAGATTRIPGWLSRLVARGLAPAAADRHADMTSIARALEGGRTRTRRIALGVGGVLAVAALALVTLPTSPCGHARAQLGDAWDDARKAAVSSHLRGLAVPWAGATATRVDDRLDAYADAWASMHEASCAATHDRGEQSMELLDRRTMCLDARRQNLDGLTRLLMDADVDLAERAVAAAEGLPAISACGELQTLLDGPAIPTEPGPRATYDDAQREIALGATAVVAAQWPVALAHCDAASLGADALDDDALRGELELVRGRALEGLGRRDDAIAALAGAARHARVARADRLAAEAEVESVFEIGYRASRFEEARWQAEHARAAVERVGDVVLEARLENNVGVVLQAAGDHDAALDRLRRGLDLREQALGADDLELAESHHNLGLVERARGNLDAARSHHERELAIVTGALGPAHPRVAEARSALGVVAMFEGDVASALATWKDVAQMQRLAFGRPHPAVANTLGLIGHAEASQGDYAGAAAHLSEALAMLEQTVGGETTEADRVHHNLGGALSELKDYAGARREFAKAVAGRERRLGPDHPDLARSLTQLGNAMISDGSPVDARAVLQRALVILERGDDALAKGRAHIAMAGALDGPAAREHAELARQYFTTAGAGGAKGLAQAQKFLADHPAPASP